MSGWSATGPNEQDRGAPLLADAVIAQLTVPFLSLIGTKLTVPRVLGVFETNGSVPESHAVSVMVEQLAGKYCTGDCLTPGMTVVAVTTPEIGPHSSYLSDRLE